MTTPSESRSLDSLKETWTYSGTPSSLTCAYKFRDFDQAWAFMNAVAASCKKIGHHPEWMNIYSHVFVKWTTHHNALGVRKKDRVLATICDELAEFHGGEGVKDGWPGAEALLSQAKLSADCGCGPDEKQKEKAQIGSEESVVGM